MPLLSHLLHTHPKLLSFHFLLYHIFLKFNIFHELYHFFIGPSSFSSIKRVEAHLGLSERPHDHDLDPKLQSTSVKNDDLRSALLWKLLNQSELLSLYPVPVGEWPWASGDLGSGQYKESWHKEKQFLSYHSPTFLDLTLNGHSAPLSFE
jgi:hypothetical protein